MTMASRALIVLMTCVLAGLPAHAAGRFALEQAADGIHVHRGQQAESSPENGGDIANIGFIVGKRCIAVIDTGGTAAIGRDLLTAIRQTSRLPICYVINTHVHPDHTLGDSAFKDSGAEFVAHASFPAALAARRDGYQSRLAQTLGDVADGSDIVVPSRVVAADDTLQLDLGGRTIRVQAWPTAHTDHDVTVFDEQTATLWTGDLLFVDRIPVIDGKVLGWVKVIERLRALKPAHLIPGHGPINRPFETAFDSEKNYLNNVITKMRNAVEMGRTLQAAVDSDSDSDERAHWILFDDYHRRNLTAAYTELEWE